MLAFGSFAFAAPWLLVALGGLPIIWWLLRVTPPAPRRVAFPAIRLLLGLVPREETPARTPWWLILLRMALAAVVIVAVAHPLVNPQARLAATGPIILVVDDGWAAAHDWPARQAALVDVLGEAAREGRQIVLLTTAAAPGDQALPPLAPIRAVDARAAVQALAPKPWPVDRGAALKRLEALSLPSAHSSIWLSDGIADPGGDALADFLARRGSLRYLAAGPAAAPLLLAAGNPAAPDLDVVVHSLPAPTPRRVELRASGEDGRLLARQPAILAAGADRVEVRLKMPTELRNRVTRVEVEGHQSAGSVLLIDERWRRRPVGIAAPSGSGGQPLLSNTYYIERALKPYAELRRGRAADLLKRDLSVLIYADSGPDSAAEAAAVGKWVEAGGLLLRFAGPHLAEGNGDKLLPVRLRRGGRTIGGALSWERPARLAAFAADSPFAGLAIPGDVTVSRQVLAEPDLDLANRTWARLADGTPLVTAAKRGKGWIVLVHTTANASWSNLALSGLFVQMLRRIVATSEGVPTAGEETLPPLETLDGFGHLQRAPPTVRPIAGKEAATTPVSARHPPGFYGTADARRALNLSAGLPPLAAIGGLPAGARREPLAARSREVDLRPPLLTAALVIALLDILIAYALRGLLRRRPARLAAVALLALLAGPGIARADDAFVLRATSQLHLAYVRTGDDQVDAVSRAGLVGLTETLSRRTAVEAADPIGIDLETDDLIFFPLLYWPLTDTQPPPSPRAIERINRYLDTGGTILFDTRDGDDASPGPFGGAAVAAERLRRLTQGIKMPPLVPIPPDHVLTKSFYLMHDFPGRWNVGTLWVEPVEDQTNDGVSTVIVGANDWAAAWAIDADDRPMFACVPGGEEQREMALRFGVNLVMYVLTGNYKSDQVHVPAILERLGQ
jgi:Domain of unknown function (DUF4159)/Aerotolerance regulator N-terminal